MELTILLISYFTPIAGEPHRSIGIEKGTAGNDGVFDDRGVLFHQQDAAVGAGPQFFLVVLYHAVDETYVSPPDAGELGHGCCFGFFLFYLVESVIAAHPEIALRIIMNGDDVGGFIVIEGVPGFFLYGIESVVLLSQAGETIFGAYP